MPPETHTPTHRLRTVLLVALASLILFISLLDVPSMGSPGATHQMPTVMGIGLDKWLHALGYAIFGGALVASWPRPRASALVFGAVGAVGFGAGIEALQWFHPTRTASLVDAAANAIGATTGAFLWYASRRYRPSR